MQVKNNSNAQSPKRSAKRKVEVVEDNFTKGAKVSFHPYRQTRTVRGTIISRTPSTYERKKTHEEMKLVTIKTVKGEILTKNTKSLKLLEKA